MTFGRGRREHTLSWWGSEGAHASSCWVLRSVGGQGKLWSSWRHKSQSRVYARGVFSTIRFEPPLPSSLPKSWSPPLRGAPRRPPPQMSMTIDLPQCQEQRRGGPKNVRRRLQRNTDFFCAFVLAPASFLTFGKVNPGPPQTDFFWGGRGPSPPLPRPSFLSAPASLLRLTFFGEGRGDQLLGGGREVQIGRCR